MVNFEELKKEIEFYSDGDIQHTEKKTLVSLGYDILHFTWGTTSYESFTKVISNLKKPKRFIVFGCGIGYQCFYWNNLYPEIPCIGIDLMSSRVNFGIEMIKKYQIKNVRLITGNLLSFDVNHDDLIWQNNLMFHREIRIFNFEKMKLYNCEIISYASLDSDNDIENESTTFDFSDSEKFENLLDTSLFGDTEIRFENRNIKLEILASNNKKINCKKFIIDTSWYDQQRIFYYYRDVPNPEFDVSFVKEEFRIPENQLKEYEDIVLSKRLLKSKTMSLFYNKELAKKKFKEIGFNVPETYFYSDTKCNLVPILQKLDSFVAKPAHFSESIDIYKKTITTKNLDLNEINSTLNQRIDVFDEFWRFKKFDGGIWFQENCERGIIVEQLVNVTYELKVFVVFGEPVIADLRKNHLESERVDFIFKENSYLNWDNEYELIKRLAIDLRIDFFRIDFLYDGENFYCNEFAFMPGTLLPNEIKETLSKRIRDQYFKFYYGSLFRDNSFF